MDENSREKAVARLEQLGIKEIKIVNGKYVFIFDLPLVYSADGLSIENQDGLNLSGLGIGIQRFIGSEAIFRAMRDVSVEELTQCGVDKVGVKPILGEKNDMEIFAAPYLPKAAAYGRTTMSVVWGEALAEDITVAIYGESDMQDLGRYKYKFRVDPKIALKGVLVLKGNKDELK